MVASRLFLGFAAATAILAGCATVVHPGLANAPGLGGATPETRVHDVIANGRDACERPAFPPGEVLRGQVPPCEGAESVTWKVPVTLTAPPKPAAPDAYPVRPCPPGSEHDHEMVRVDAFPLSAPGWALACSIP